MERQDHQLEDELVSSKSTQAVFKAGGIDGGFSSQRELLDILA